jgi:hypothetical protein
MVGTGVLAGTDDAREPADKPGPIMAKFCSRRISTHGMHLPMRRCAGPKSPHRAAISRFKTLKMANYISYIIELLF